MKDWKRVSEMINCSLAFHQIVHEKEIQAEDDQVFLVKLQVSNCCLYASWFAARWYSK